MKITILPGKVFIRKSRQLAKKYPSLVADLKKLTSELQEKPDTGVDLGNGLRKVRMSIASKGKGKSEGARVITYTVIISREETRITLLTIYDKSSQTNISDKELKLLVAELNEENQ